MPLPYENTTSGDKAIGEIQKLLSKFGCQSFGHMTDMENQELLIQFKYRNTPVTVKASVKGYAALWLKEHPWNDKRKSSLVEWERKALDVASTAVYSVLRDWIKGQVMAIETGILSFEGAFLGQIMLPSGKTILEHATENKLLMIGDK